MRINSFFLPLNNAIIREKWYMALKEAFRKKNSRTRGPDREGRIKKQQTTDHRPEWPGDAGYFTQNGKMVKGC